MKTRHVVCDRCGATIDLNVTVSSGQLLPVTILRQPIPQFEEAVLTRINPNLDLCSSCHTVFMDWVKRLR